MRKFLRRAAKLVVRVCLEVAVFVLILFAVWQVLNAGMRSGLPAMLVVAFGGIVGLYGMIVVHELGHAAAAWGLGVSLASVTLGFVRLDRSNGKLRPRLNFRWSRNAGQVVPAAQEIPGWHFVWFVLAGPAANLVVGLACLALADMVNTGPPFAPEHRGGWSSVAMIWPGSPLDAWLNVVGLTGVGFGLMNLVPNTHRKQRSDGGLVLDLLTGKLTKQPAVGGPG